MQNKPTTILNLMTISEATAPCSIEATPKNNSFLQKKTKRSAALFISSLEKGNQCSICLEFDHYSPSKCIQCSNCKSYCHIQCYIDNISHNINLNNFICQTCLNKTSNNFNNQKCSLCSCNTGILKEVVPNFFSHVYCLKFIKEVQEENFQIRKWRYRSVCKLCQNKKGEKSFPVIKCSNTKCRNYYHIQCAIENGLIFNLGFQKDFYGLGIEEKNNNKNIEETYPFYCNYHNKILIKEYEDYIKQMDSVLDGKDTDKKKEDVQEEQIQVSIPIEKESIKDESKEKEEITNSKATEIDENEEVINPIKEVSNSNINKLNNKEDFLKVNFDYDNKNNNSKENEHLNNGDLNEDDVDLFKNFEQMNKKSENHRFFNSFSLEYF